MHIEDTFQQAYINGSPITVITILCHKITSLTLHAHETDGLQKYRASVSKPLNFMCINLPKSGETIVHK